MGAQFECRDEDEVACRDAGRTWHDFLHTCEWSGSACPPGWTSTGHTQTVPGTCTGNSDGCGRDRYPLTCTTGWHAFGTGSVEQCLYETRDRDLWICRGYTRTCRAAVAGVGCVPCGDGELCGCPPVITPAGPYDNKRAGWEPLGEGCSAPFPCDEGKIPMLDDQGELFCDDPPSGCGGATLSWTVLDVYTCSAHFGPTEPNEVTPHLDTFTATDSAPLHTGSATFTCDDGVWTGPTDETCFCGGQCVCEGAGGTWVEARPERPRTCEGNDGCAGHTHSCTTPATGTSGARTIRSGSPVRATGLPTWRCSPRARP